MSATLDRLAREATATLQREQWERGFAARKAGARYGTPAEVAAGVADVLERRKTVRAPGTERQGGNT